jgi:hypothetical protein
MTFNPYESPQSPPVRPTVSPAAETTPPAYRLFSRDAVFLAALLGGPAAGAILLAANYGRLGRRAQARRTTLGGLVGQVAVFLAAAAAPHAGWWIAGALVVASLMWCAAYGLQAGPFALHLARGGSQEVIGQALLIGTAGLLLSFPVVMLLRYWIQ